MNKGFRYWFRCITVATLAALITFNPAWAGRGIRSLFAKRNTECCVTEPPANVCCPEVAVNPCEPVCPESVPTVTDCCSSPAVVVDPCGQPSSSVIESPSTDATQGAWESPAPSQSSADSPTQDGPSAPQANKPESKPAEPKPAEVAPAVPEPASPTEPNPPLPEASPSDSTVDQAPAPTEDAPAVDAPALPADVPPALPDTGNDSLFDEPGAKPADSTPPLTDPFDALPAEPDPAAPTGNDPFGAPAETTPAAPAENDPFSLPPATEPSAAEPSTPEPASNDPFGAQPEETTPAVPAGDDPFGAPPAETEQPQASDLFGEPAAGAAPAEPAVSDLFGTDPQSSDKPLGEADLAPAADNLFGDPEPEPAAPAPANDVEDLFGNPTEESNDSDQEATDSAASEEATEPSGDLFGEPTSANPVGNDFDDLFGIPAVAEEPLPEVTEGPDSLDDIFKTTRTWHDNTGIYQVDAQLVVIFADSVRLLKENGKFCTLPIRRLSDHDKRYVEQLAQILPGSDAKYVSAVK